MIRGRHLFQGRQADVKSTTLAGTGRFSPETPTVLFDNPAADEKPETHPGEAAIVHIGSPMEAIKKMRQVPGRYPNTLVRHSEMGCSVFAPHSHLHNSAFGTVFDSVLKQIINKLHNPNRI